MASRIVSLIQDQNLNVQFNGKANISKAPRKASTGGRKPLGDLSNSVNPTAKQTSKKESSKIISFTEKETVAFKLPNDSSKKKSVPKASEKVQASGRKALSDISNSGKPHLQGTSKNQTAKLCIPEDIGEIAQTAINGPKNLQVHRIVASELWSFDSSSSNLCGRYLSPWNVLQCYLESIQVGCINEMIGNGVEAESFLLSGKSISCSQNLPLFEATFSSILGKLYRKKRLWNFAEQELQSAKRLLVDSSSHCSCIRCRLMLEANLDQQLGDLFRNLFDISIINDSKGKLSRAEVLYKSALEKLNCSEWKNIICDAESNVDLAVRNTIINGEDVAGNTATQPEAIGARKGRKTKNVSKSVVKEQHVIPERRSSRVTRSRFRSSQNQSTTCTGEAPIEISKHSNGNVASKLSDTCWEKDSLLGKGSCIEELTSEIACFCNQTKCWQCLPAEIMKSGLLIYFIDMKWEYAHRTLLVRILTGTGKCLGYGDQTHEIHEGIWQSILTCKEHQRTKLQSYVFQKILQRKGFCTVMKNASKHRKEP